MIKIFREGRGGDTFKTPSNSFCLYVYPPPVLRCFWKDPLMTPTPPPPTSSIFHWYPTPSTTPSPSKNFDHTQCELHTLLNTNASTAKDHGEKCIKVRPPVDRHLLRIYFIRRYLIIYKYSFRRRKW